MRVWPSGWHRLPGDRDNPLTGHAAEDRRGRLLAPGPGKAGDPDDLARADREADAVNGSGRQPVDDEPRLARPGRGVTGAR